MAEIEIQKKERPPVWPWLLGLLVLALVIWAVVDFGTEDELPLADVETEVIPGVVPLPQEDGQGQLPQEVQQFASECMTAPAQDQTDMGRQHEYTANCMQQLASGIEAVLERDQRQDEGVTRNLDALRTSVQQLQSSDASATQHANLTRAAAMRALDTIENARTLWYAARTDVDSAISEARTAAESITADTPLLEQRDEVHRFFREAGEALQAIAQGTQS